MKQGLYLPPEMSRSHIPLAVQEAVKAIDPALEIRAREVANQRDEAESGVGWNVMRPTSPAGLSLKWGVLCRWSPSDPRRAMVAKGEVSEENAVDWLGDVPTDCAPEQIPGWLQRSLSPMDKREDVRRVLDRVTTHNEAQSLRNEQGVKDYAEGLMETFGQANKIQTEEGRMAFLRELQRNMGLMR